jgi:hypothetical protein
MTMHRSNTDNYLIGFLNARRQSNFLTISLHYEVMLQINCHMHERHELHDVYSGSGTETTAT